MVKWCNGVANIEELTGEAFYDTTYKEIGHFYFWGNLDETSHCLSFEVKCWDSDPLKSLTLQCNYLINLGLEVICKQYVDLENKYTDEMHQDTFDFLVSNRVNLINWSTLAVVLHNKKYPNFLAVIGLQINQPKLIDTIDNQFNCLGILRL